ncbi:MAG: hypothetical protein JWM99_4339 [Verrucomicrobiales bacterium]|nr:hypothetical protein [Verrucomicrobiales bacterium]
MVIIDANLLIYAINIDSPFYVKSKLWLETTLSGAQGKVMMPWLTIVAFVRVATHPRILANPLRLSEALNLINEWLSLPSVEILHPTAHHARYFAAMCESSNAKTNLVTDAHLAALAIENNFLLASCDSDFAKFPGLRWINPVAE